MSRNLFQLFAEVVMKIIRFLWVSSTMNKADIGTKDLRGNNFTRLADQTFSRLIELKDTDPKVVSIGNSKEDSEEKSNK